MTRQPLREALKNLQAARDQLALAIRDVEAAIGAPLDRGWTFTLGELIGIHGEEPHAQDRDDARRNEGVQTSSGQP